MEWRAIPGYEGRYEISEYGDVKSLARHCLARGGKPRSVPERILRTVRDKDGYHMVTLYTGKSSSMRLWKIHRLVLLAWVGAKPEDLESRHLDDNKDNNHYSNLCYGTQQEQWEDWRRNSGETHRNWNR